MAAHTPSWRCVPIAHGLEASTAFHAISMQSPWRHIRLRGDAYPSHTASKLPQPSMQSPCNLHASTYAFVEMRTHRTRPRSFHSLPCNLHAISMQAHTPSWRCVPIAHGLEASTAFH